MSVEIKNGIINEQQLEKYIKITKHVVSNVSKAGFSLSRTLTEWKTSSYLGQAFVDLGILNPVGKRGNLVLFEANYTADQITRELVLSIYAKVYEYGNDAYKKSREKAASIKPNEEVENLRKELAVVLEELEAAKEQLADQQSKFDAFKEEARDKINNSLKLAPNEKLVAELRDRGFVGSLLMEFKL